MIITDNYPPPGTPVQPHLSHKHYFTVNPQHLWNGCVSVTSSEWQWFSQRYSQVRPSKSTSTFHPYPPFLDIKKKLFLFSQRRFINQWDRVSVRNCSVQSFLKWDIILSRWQISLAKRGQCWYFARRKEGLTGCCSAWGSERLNEWANEWVNGWLSEGRVQITCSLTDRGKLQRSASIPPHRPPASASGCSTGLRGKTRCWIISPHDCISGQIFYLIQYKVLVFELSHSIRTTYSDCFFPWNGGMGWSQDFFRCAGKYQKILNISFTVHMWCAFKIRPRTFVEHCKLSQLNEVCQVENINEMQIKLYQREYIVHKGISNAKQQTERGCCF